MTEPKKPTEIKRTRELYRVWYDDGTVSDLINLNRPKALMVYALEHDNDAPENVTEISWLIWHIIGRPDTFDGWIETVEDVQVVEQEQVGKVR